MSGIAAILERTGAPAGKARIAAMLARLRHRGPDRGAFHVDGSAAVVQTMLETTPEDALDRQPLASRSGALWLVADARVDNRRELFELCPEPGDAAGLVSDAALILRAYERWGEACPARLVGDFAFVIWDAEAARLFCARDPLGTRFLYYHHDAASFRCATEMNALFADERVPRRPDRSSLALFLAHEYSERDETLYEGIHALPPGHTLTATRAAIHRRCYWQPDPSRAAGAADRGDPVERFGAAFAEAVRCRLRADRPVAAHVSGGLDSSSVACEAERLRRAGRAPDRSLMLIRAAFPGLPCDETPYSQAVADHLGLPIATAYPADYPGICSLEMPYPDLYFHPTRNMLDPLLPELRRRGVRVVLTGADGDLLMQPSGYEGAHYLREGRLRAALEDAARGSLSRGALRRLAGQALWALSPRVAARLRRAMSRAGERWPWLSREVAAVVEAHWARAGEEARALHPDLLTAELCRGVTHGVGTHLSQALLDRADGLNQMDQRHAFRDVRVVEALLDLPSDLRFTRRESKRVLRRALGPDMPRLVRERRDKAEFGSFVQRAFLVAQRSALQRLLRRSRLEELGLVRAGPLQQLLDAEPPAQNAIALTNLAAMELWLRNDIHRTFPERTSSSLQDRHEHGS